MAAEFPIALQILWHSADIFQIIIHPALLSKDGLKSFPAKNKDLQRSMLVQETGDSKTVKLRTFRGFLVNCYEPVHARIGNSEFVISPPEGSAVFIQNPDEFHIPSDVTVVGVENGENFCRIRSQKHLFGDNKVLFVSRYPPVGRFKGVANQNS